MFQSQTSNPEQSMCTDCGAAVLSKNLNRHMKQHTHTQDTGLQASCVDSCNGLFLVTKTKRGRQDPIHVQHKTWGTNHQIQCSDKNCRDAKKIAIESERYGWICDHIKATQHSHVDSEDCNLSEACLREAVKNKVINDDVCKDILSEKKLFHWNEYEAFLRNKPYYK